MAKIVVLDGYALNPGDLSWEGIQAQGGFTLYDRSTPDQAVQRIGDSDIVFTNKIPITEQVLAACPGIRFIGVLATGYNVVDLEAAKKRGIPVCNVPIYGTSAVAQFTFALLLEACHRVGHHAQAVQEGRWAKSQDFCFWDFPLVELAGKTMGLVGFGRIGKAVARIADALGMQVLAYDANPDCPDEGLGRIVALEELLRLSDVVSLHCPLLPSTQGMIDSEALGKMKQGAILINTSRGPLVDEVAVRGALEDGHLAYYLADVAATEPMPQDSPLLGAPNAIVTPHIAWASKESRQRLMDIAAGNLRQFLAGSPVNVVNP